MTKKLKDSKMNIDDNEALAIAEALTSLKYQLMSILDTLTGNEEKVLILRFGLDGGKLHSLEDVAKKLNMTNEEVRFIETNVLNKLKSQSNKESS